MQPARTDTTVSPIARFGARIKGFGPVLGLLALCIAGTLLNGDFATLDNLMNVLTRTAFIGIIAVGMTFVIISGGHQPPGPGPDRQLAAGDQGAVSPEPARVRGHGR